MPILPAPHDLEGQQLSRRHPDPAYSLEKTRRRITHQQAHYLIVHHTLLAGLIDGAINFAIACAMYRTTHKEIRLWPLKKNTIAGDMGVTIIIQGVLTMLITGSIVRHDIRTGSVEPFSFPWPKPQREVGVGRWRSYLAKAINFLSPTQTLSLDASRGDFSKSLSIILLRGFVISFFYFCLLWPIAIAITAPLYGGIDMRGTWTSEIIVGLFGGIYGLVMNPFVAALVLGASTHQTDLASKRKIASTTPLASPEMRHAVVEPGDVLPT